MAREHEPIVFISGYGEDPDMVRPFVDELSEQLDREVAVADHYRSGDERRREQGQLPSVDLALRTSHQLGFDTLARGVIPVSHSRGARVASHLHAKPDEVFIAPEGITAGGRDLIERFAKDTLRRRFFGNTDERAFARQQIANLTGTLRDSAEQALEMRRRAADFRENAAARALLVAFTDDAVVSYQDTVAPMLIGHSGLKLRKFQGAGHYHLLEQPAPVAEAVADHLLHR